MTAILTPLVEQEAVKLSQDGKTLYRKQILPRGEFDYKGEKINFDVIGQDVKAAFEAGAMDQVPFQLADGANRHNFDPKNYRGDLVKMELAEDGVYGTFDFSKFPDMQEMIEKNPKFGVSAHIERGGDHKHAFAHVLGTLNPRVKGMKPWEKVELSDDTDLKNAIDLVDVELSGDGDVTKTTAKPEGDTVTLSKTDYERIMGVVTAQEQFEKAINLSNNDGDGEEENPAIKLANERADNAMKLAREGQIELAKTRWEKKEAELKQAGVPPVMLSKAAALLSAPKSDVKPISLSNDGSDAVDPQAVLLAVLEEAKGIVNLSKDEGHEVDLNGESSDSAEEKAFRDAFFADQF